MESELRKLSQAELRQIREWLDDFIDFRFDACTESGWQLEENGIETRVVNLSRRAHEPSGLRTRAAFPAAMSRSDR